MANTKESKKETKNKNVHEVVIKMEGDVWQEALDQTFKQKQKDAKVDGFRKGKVPKEIYIKKFGLESLFLPAADKLVQKAYDKALKDSTLEPIIQPDVNLKDINQDYVEFIFKIITKPEIQIKKYKGLNIKPEKVTVEKEEIEHELSHILEKYTELVNKDGKVESGNIAVIDFEGFKDQEAFEGGKGENYSLEIGSNTFIPGFEDQVIGMKVGEEKEINLTFPEDYQAKDLAGVEVVFKVKVNEIKEKQVRQLDQEFFEDLAMEGVDSKEKLEKEIENSIKARKETEAENRYVDKILEEVSKQVEIDLPEEIVEEEVTHLMHRFEEQLKMQGIGLDIYYQITKSSEQDLKNTLEKEAYSNVLYRFMLEEIMKLEKVEVSSTDTEKEAEELAKKYNMEKDELLKRFGGMEMIQYDLQMRKTIDLLKELNQ